MSQEERDLDKGRIDDAIDRVLEILDAPLPDIAQPNVLALARDARLKAADRLVSLLERRSKLLGLDAQPATESAPQAGKSQDGSAIVRAILDGPEKKRAG